MPAGPLEALEVLYAIGIPALFWTGLVAGVVVSASSSSPYFLGNRFFTRAYIGIIILFVTNLVHQLFAIPHLGSPAFEYTLIMAALVALFVFVNLCDEASKRNTVLQDPKAQLCPKCGVILDRIFRVCPRCDTTLPGESPGSPAEPKGGREK